MYCNFDEERGALKLMNNSANNNGMGIRYYEKIFEYAADAIFVETADGRILDVNPAACTLLGYSREELLQINIIDLLDLADKENIAELVDHLESSGEVFSCNNIRKDGTKVPVEVRIRSYFEDGEKRMIVIARNVIKQVQAMAEIKKQNDYMLLLHEMNIDTLDQLDLTALLNNIVRRAGEMFGATDAFLYLVDEARGVAEMKAGIGRNANLYGYTQKIGHGAAGVVASTGESLIIENYPQWPNRDHDARWDNLQTCVSIPFKYGDKVIGVLGLDYFELARFFTAADMELFSRFADLVSIALFKANLHKMLSESEKSLQEKNIELTATNEELIASEEELRQQFEQLQKSEEKVRRQSTIFALLNKIALGLMNQLEINEVLRTVAAYACDLFGTTAFVGLVDEQRNLIEMKAGAPNSSEMDDYTVRLGEGVTGKVAQTGQPLVIEDYQTWPGRLPGKRFEKLRTCVCVPLISGEKSTGVIVISFRHPRSFSDEDMELLARFAKLASVALYNASIVADYRREIEERILTEEALRVSERKYKNLYVEFEEKQALLVSLINSIPDLIFYKDSNSTYLGCNKAFEEFAGMKEKDLIGLTDKDIFSKDMADLFRKMDLEMMRKGETNRNEELVTYPDGRKILLDTLKTPYYDNKGNALGLIGISRDITERKKKEDEIIYLSLHDALTGLYNRSFFEEEMKRFEKIRDICAGIIVCDVDGLKIINDTLGHNTGDLILKAVAKILKSSFRAGDLIARIGGDEFAVLTNHNSERVLELDCVKIKEQVEMYNNENKTIPISLSVGFAASKGNALNMNALYKEADNNMYREKLHRDKSSRSAIVQTLMKALEARDFQTEGHSDRMQEFIASFAHAIGLPEQNLADLRLLARFHDIGKVGIPDSILFKPDKLTGEEIAIMRHHCEIGYRIALAAPDLAPIADWILKHQEWWDGNGYPLGIAGEDIPLACRMLSIVDAFDAMTSDRPYRKALSRRAAIGELNRCAGTQFDPKLVKDFVELMVFPE